MFAIVTLISVMLGTWIAVSASYSWLHASYMADQSSVPINWMEHVQAGAGALLGLVLIFGPVLL